MSKITTSIILDKRKANKNLSSDKIEIYPVKLRVTYQRKFRLYNLDKYLSEDDFNAVTSKNPRKERIKDLKLEFANIEANAREKIDNLQMFSFDNFRDAFYTSDDKQQDVYSCINRYVKQLKKEGRVSTASSYELTEKSLKKLKSKLTFTDITPKFLHEYERMMLGKERSLSTIGIYLRNLRAIYNEAIRKGSVSMKYYPFGKPKEGKYEIPSGENVKKALTLDEIAKIFNYPTIEGTNEDLSKDLWIFSYITNGINMNDIARLKYRNIQGNKIEWIRQKTKNTTRKKQKKISAAIVPVTRNIINKWGNPGIPDNYIFNMLKPGLTPEQERAAIQRTLKRVNVHLKKMAKEIGIDKPITTYTARHSFATVLRRTGAPIEFASECLGHATVQQTQDYIDSIQDEEKMNYINKLTEFKKPQDG
mgnify:CR=1 FL=1